MDLVKLSRISMKHLITLHLLVKTHSVTLTAERLCVSPSSVSKILSQLRGFLDDELFYRRGNQLVATPLAKRLAPLVNQMVLGLDQIVTQENFDAQNYRGKFALSMRESCFELFGASLASDILTKAPDINLDIHSKDNIGIDGLLAGKLDFVILPHDKSQPPANHSDLTWHTLLDDKMVCLMSPSHPLANKSELSLDDYLSYGHIGINDSDLHKPFFEMELAQQERHRNVAIRVPDFGAAALMCHQSQLLFTSSAHWAKSAKQADGLISKSLPFNYGEVVYSLVSVSHSMHHPAHRWMHKQILACCEQDYHQT